MSLQLGKIPALLICGTKTLGAVALLFCRLAAPAGAASCGATGEIISNDMRLVAGSGDTLWIASSSTQGWGVNYTLNRGKTWWGYYLGCHNAWVTDIAFAKGMLVAVCNPFDYETSRWKPGKIWHYSHGSGQIGTFDLQWPDTVFRADSLAVVNAVDAVAAGSEFFFACQNGGLLRWNPAGGIRRAYLPGISASFNPTQFRPDTGSFGKSRTKVTALDRMITSGDTQLVAVTPPQLWFFRPADSAWDTGVAAILADTSLAFQGFVSALVNNLVQPPILYGYIYYRENTTDSLCSLFRYHSARRQWSRVLKDAPKVVAPAVHGYLYAVHGENQVAVFRDSVADTVMTGTGGLTAVITAQDFDRRFIYGSTLQNPGIISDMGFVQTSDSSGHLYIASSLSQSPWDGLFFSWTELPGSTMDSLTNIRRARAIRGGLGETYALPGIITDDYRAPKASRTTFVYKLSRDANVTIRMYDINMQYVKSIIENAPRKAATPLGRSTDSRADQWDGTTAAGRPVAPGVYYYKITASTGERSFGKIVVAKGQGNY